MIDNMFSYTNAYDQGYEVAKCGGDIDDNPYIYYQKPHGSKLISNEMHNVWSQGFLEYHYKGA